MLYTYLPKFLNSTVLVQLIIFLQANSSLIICHFLLRSCSLGLLVSGHFKRVCTASSSPLHRDHLPISKPFLIPLNFQIPALNHAIPFWHSLSTTLHNLPCPIIIPCRDKSSRHLVCCSAVKCHICY
jgi:hypothetical protein